MAKTFYTLEVQTTRQVVLQVDKGVSKKQILKEFRDIIYPVENFDALLKVAAVYAATFGGETLEGLVGSVKCTSSELLETECHIEEVEDVV